MLVVGGEGGEQCLSSECEDSEGRRVRCGTPTMALRLHIQHREWTDIEVQILTETQRVCALSSDEGCSSEEQQAGCEECSTAVISFSSRHFVLFREDLRILAAPAAAELQRVHHHHHH